MTNPFETQMTEGLGVANENAPDHVLHLRRTSLESLKSRGLPTRRVEEWKYTDLRKLMRDDVPPADRPSAEGFASTVGRSCAFDATGAVPLSLIDGYGAEKPSSLPFGLTLLPLVEALEKNHPSLQILGRSEAAKGNAAYALNAAFFADGWVVHVAENAAIEAPLLIRHIAASANVSTASRLLVILDKGASLTLLESHEGEGFYQANTVAEIVVADDARLNHVRLNGEGEDALSLSTLTVELGARTRFDTLNVALGSAASRHQVYVRFAGEDSEAAIRGATMLKASQHGDTTLVIDHAAPNGNSRELFKTVIDGAATGVFQGKIIVRPDAQKTDGRMMSASLLLSEDASMYNKPELEIFADDVQCAHGATCGALDEDLLFYLMARGLPRKEAEGLLIESFLGEAIEEGAPEAVKDILMQAVRRWLRDRASGK